jgi:predicted dehydrogenase
LKAQINWGIIGMGRIAHKLAQDLRFVPDAKLHAVASTDMQRAADFARQYGARYHFGSYEAILNCPHLDVVYIATPHVLHCQNTLMCLRRRIPVLCEKPFGMNAHEVKQMIDMAHTNQTFLMEAMWTRFMPSFRKMLELVKSGVIGRPLSIKSDFGFYAPFDIKSRLYNKELGGGALLDIGIYPIMAALSVFGKPLTINALANMTSTGVDDTCVVNFQYADGAIAMSHATVTANTNIEAAIYGEKGMIYLHPRFHHSKALTVKLHDGREEKYEFPYDGFGYQYEVMEVNNCLKNNQLESKIMHHAFSMDLIETLDAVRKLIGLEYPNHDNV